MHYTDCERTAILQSGVMHLSPPLQPMVTPTGYLRVYIFSLLLHCCTTAATLLLYCCYTAAALLLHCGYTAATLLLYCCYTAATPSLY